MATFDVGRPVRRVEDDRLLRGAGRFVDDIVRTDQLVAYVVRSPHAHADILQTDVSRAAAKPGVISVFTGADVDADGLGDLPCLLPVDDRDGKPSIEPPARPLVRDRVRYVGEPVALIVADRETAARDAADALVVEYRPRTPAVDTAGATTEALVWDEAPQNTSFVWEDGNSDAVDKAFAEAAYVARASVVNNRVIVHPMEPRAAIGEYDATEGRYTLTTTSQGTGFLQSILADDVFKIPRDRMRVVTPDVGGGFGTSLPLYPEQVLVLWAARRLGRPIKWTNDRSQSFLSDTQGRDHVTTVALAMAADGTFTGLRVSAIANMGALLSTAGPAVPTLACKGMQSGVYRIGAAHVSVRGVFTNTAPIDAYRGAGNPEAQYALERVIDVAANEVGLDRLELRRRNVIDDIPFTTVLGHTYDAGDFGANMRRAHELIDASGLAQRQAQAADCGRRRGIGFANHIKPASGAPFGPETAIVRIDRAGKIVLLSGSQSSGQGHETAFAQMAADQLGIGIEHFAVHQGDSHSGAEGHGTSASRSMVVGGTAVRRAVDTLIAHASDQAAEHLEVAVADLEYRNGQFRVVGTDRVVGLFELAASLEPGVELSGSGSHRPTGPTYPNGCHACEVEVDPETGAVSIVAFVAVDDYGNVVNPILLAGQVHGGVVQGIGQAVLEHARYERETGQLLTGSLMDYALPRAGDVPYVDTEWNGTPCPSNPLGVKGGGESGCVGASPAVINAIVDALADFGVHHVDMPATPERVWQAIRDAN